MPLNYDLLFERASREDRRKVAPTPATSDIGRTINPFTLPFVPLIEHGELPDCMGLYFVIDGDRILYIGRTVDLQRRWVGHHRYAQVKAIAKDPVIAWLEVAGENLLNAETVLIQRFRPILNGTRVPKKGESPDPPPPVDPSPRPSVEDECRQRLQEAVRKQKEADSIPRSARMTVKKIRDVLSDHGIGVKPSKICDAAEFLKVVVHQPGHEAFVTISGAHQVINYFLENEQACYYSLKGNFAPRRKYMVVGMFTETEAQLFRNAGHQVLAEDSAP